MRQVVPDKNEMEKYVAAGLTQKQIAEDWSKRTNETVSRTAIAMAIQRYGLTSKRSRPRYEDMLPWRVSEEHQDHRDARLLRLEGRRRRGEPISKENLTWLANWKRALLDMDAVVTYDPQTEEGFFWTNRREGDDDIIRR